jgi:hypothetical protein
MWRENMEKVSLLNLDDKAEPEILLGEEFNELNT